MPYSERAYLYRLVLTSAQAQRSKPSIQHRNWTYSVANYAIINYRSCDRARAVSILFGFRLQPGSIDFNRSSRIIISAMKL